MERENDLLRVIPEEKESGGKGRLGGARRPCQYVFSGQKREEEALEARGREMQGGLTSAPSSKESRVETWAGRGQRPGSKPVRSIH